MQSKESKRQTRSLERNLNQPLTKLEEQQLLQRLAAGEINVFWQLWKSHEKYLYSRCIGWMGSNPVEAEEAMSLAMLKAREKLLKYAGEITNLRAWFTRLTYNLCMDIHRKLRRKAIGIENIEDIASEAGEAVISSWDSPEAAILRDELTQFIRNTVNALPDRLRTPFLLRYYQEVSYPDIARQLAISQDNAYKRTQQGRDLLEKRLQKYLSGADHSWLSSSDTSETTSNSVAESFPFKSPVLKETKCMITVIDYNLTAVCQEKLSQVWYQSPCLQG